MNLGFSSSVAALNVFSTALGVSANNVAHINQIGAEKQGVSFSTNSLNEVTVSITNENLSEAEKSEFAEYHPNNVDIASEFVDQMIYAYAFQANLAVLSKSTAIEKQLVNMKI